MLQHGSFPGYAGAGSRSQPDSKGSSSKASCFTREVRVSRIPLLPAIPVYLQMLSTFGRRQAGEVKRYSSYNRAGNTDLFGVQPLLNRMQHIHVDHALVTQALEHLTLVTNDRQPKRSHLALQRYGLQLLGGEIGIILQKPAGLNAGIMLEIQFVANIRQRLWADIVLGGKILQGIIGLPYSWYPPR